MKKYSLTSAYNQQGFTLIEILIAITLLAFITLGVVSVTENASLTMERTTEINKNNLQIETAMSRFEWDFSQIYSPLYFSTLMNTSQSEAVAARTQPNPALQEYYQQLSTRFQLNEHFNSISKEGLPVPRFYAPEKDVFEFFTSSNRRKLENTKQSHFAWVRYSLGEAREKDPGEEENPDIPKSLKTLVRYFAADDPYDDKRIDITDAARVKGAVLLENVESLEFQYWDYARKKWETSLKTINQGENIIRGVKILLTWYDSRGQKRSISRIFRNHWPMVVPQDQGTTANGTTTGSAATTGSANGTSTGSSSGSTGSTSAGGEDEWA